MTSLTAERGPLQLGLGRSKECGTSQQGLKVPPELAAPPPFFRLALVVCVTPTGLCTAWVLTDGPAWGQVTETRDPDTGPCSFFHDFFSLWAGAADGQLQCRGSP